MQHKRFVGIFAIIMLLGSLLAPAGPALAQDSDAPIAPNPDSWQSTAQQGRTKPRVIGETDPAGAEQARYTVLLTSPPLALYRGDMEGLAATSPAINGSDRLALKSDAATAYAQHLAGEQRAALAAIAAAIGRAPAVVFSYQVTLNGFTVELTPREAQQVVALEGVKSVTRDGLYELHTDAGPAWIGAPAVWDGTALPDGIGKRGEGVVVGVLDTGIDQNSPSFAAVSGDGYVHSNPRGKYYGVCDPESDDYVETFACNDKLIGGWDYIGYSTGPVDNHGHGSHTASTAAGNLVANASFVTPGYTYEATISGVAHRANIIAYKVCASFGCPFSAIQAGIEQAAIDQVDVINFSVGGGPNNPWSDSVAEGFLATAEAGVTVATSAGNSGPGARTVGSPANAPWLLSVGASSHNRSLNAMLTDMLGSSEPPPAITGKGATTGYGPAPVVYAGYYGNPECYDYYWSPDTFTNEIVLCDRGEGSRIYKGMAVRAAGGKGMILANSIFERASLFTEAHVLPTTHISYIDGLRLKLWLASGADHTATISGTVISLATENGDIMASFSSRGYNRPLPDVIKPDIAAPGVDVFAAYADGQDFTFVNGTSMASPHVAGAAALVKDVHPEWTPAEIRSALMLTARADVMRKEDGASAATPFDSGAGRVAVDRAVRAGFVLDESSADFEAANPAGRGDPTALNLPSLGNGDCIARCSWTRVLKSTQPTPVTWAAAGSSADGLTISVEPASFTLAANGVQTVTVTASAGFESLGHWAFGDVTFTPDNSALPNAHFPMAVYSSAGELDDVKIETRRSQGAYTIEDIVTISMDDLETTIYADVADVQRMQIGYDFQTFSPYDNLESVGVTWTLQSISDTARFFEASIYDSTAYDLDLYVGYDANGDGRPAQNEELCVPFSYSSNETCLLTAPLTAGDYWVMVYNYYSSSYEDELDRFTRSILVVDETDTDAVTATGPTSVDGGEPFDLQINWDSDSLKAGDVYMGVIEMGPKGSDRVVLDAPIELKRIEDDVRFESTSSWVWPGRTVNYTVEVIAESSLPLSNIGYDLIATLPPGMSYVPDSASLEPTSVDGNVIRWQNVPVVKVAYVMSDSIDNPLCDTDEGGYINLEDYYIFPRENIQGDDFIHDIDDFFFGYGDFDFYGVEHPGFYVTANGFGTYDPQIGAQPDLNSDLPDPAAPNSLVAPFWRDLEVVYDPVLVRGVSIAGKGSGYVMLIEFDDVEPAPAGSTDERFDFEILLRRQVDNNPGVHEIVMAYNNLNGSFSPATIGIENPTGSVAEKYAYNDADLSDGLMICYDWTSPTTTITFQATVDEAALTAAATTPLVTTLDHAVNAVGFEPARIEMTHELYTDALERMLLPVVER